MKILAFLSVIVSIGILILAEEWVILVVYIVIAILLIWGGEYLENSRIN